MVAKRGSTKLGDVLACKKKYASHKITNAALDGTPYIQTTGEATQYREVALYSATEAMRIAMDGASNDGALISVEWRDGTIKGFVDGEVTWREWTDGHGVCKFVLLVKEVVST